MKFTVAIVLSILGAGRTLDDGQQVVEGIVNAKPSEVWSVFSTPDGFKKLGVAQCEMDIRVGGLIRTHYDPKGTIGDEGTIENEILAFEPGRMLAIRIRKPPKGFPFAEASWKAAWTVITVTDLGDGRTHLRLAGLGYPDTDDGRKMREFFRNGNGWTLDKLKARYEAAPPPARSPHPASTTAPIGHELLVDLPRAEVWKLISTSAGWKQFFGVDTRIELRPGGKFEILFGKDAPAGQQGSEGCTVLSFLPEQMLSYTWNAPPKFEHARARFTWVVVRLEEASPTRTRILLDHHGFAEQAAANPDHREEWEQVRAYFDAAWPKVLGAIKGQEKK
jgi:uncharacterized protein YndB with AHSA1/START domain